MEKSTITTEERYELFFDLKDKQRDIARLTGVNVRAVLDDLSTDEVTEDTIALAESYCDAVREILAA